MYIKHVLITGFWGDMQVETDLSSDVTIFIGANGTGKTTLINLLVASLSVDYDALVSWQFDSVSITLAEQSPGIKTERLRVRRMPESSPPEFEYELGSRRYLVERDARRHRQRVLFDMGTLGAMQDSNAHRDITELRDRLASLVSLSWIAVHRYAYTEQDEDPSVARQFAIDERLRVMLARLARMQLQIERESQKLSRKFQSSALALLLYNPELDSFDKIIQGASAANLQAEEQDFRSAIELLGIKVPAERISLHFQMLKTALRTVNAIGQRATNEVNFENLILLPMMLRTRLVIEELKNTEVRRDALRRPLVVFLAVLHEFIIKKGFWFDPRSSDLRVAVRQAKVERPIEMTDLSSGEKQLLIQLLEVVLQEQRPAVLIADEPELSLHVTWQEKLLKALRKLNSNAQIIVATHSPDIVGQYRSSVIDMENIVRESGQ